MGLAISETFASCNISWTCFGALLSAWPLLSKQVEAFDGANQLPVIALAQTLCSESYNALAKLSCTRTVAGTAALAVEELGDLRLKWLLIWRYCFIEGKRA